MKIFISGIGMKKPPSYENFVLAQKNYSNFFINIIKKYQPFHENNRILDIGCGTGNLLRQLLMQNYNVDAVSPAQHWQECIKNNIEKSQSQYSPHIFFCKFEQLEQQNINEKYDVVYFCESFQYMELEKVFPILNKILKKDGHVIICDFFQRDSKLSQEIGSKVIGGGHFIKKFLYHLQKSPFKIVEENDITQQTSPTVTFIEHILTERVQPSLTLFNKFFTARYPKVEKIIKLLFSKKIRKLKLKYLSGQRNKDTFEKYKIYQLFVLKKNSL